VEVQMPDSLSKRQIRNIMRAEHKSSGITKINPGLYRALNQYLQRLHDAYLKAHEENKTHKALTLTKEIRDTERDISTIYELRERKILLMAQDIVRSGAPSLKYLFPEEKLLLLRLSSILLETRKDIRIDFHDQVTKYIRTIAKEYDLERKLFAPFHPTAPFCEEDGEETEESFQPSDQEPPPTPIESPAPSPRIPSQQEKGEESVAQVSNVDPLPLNPESQSESTGHTSEGQGNIGTDGEDEKEIGVGGGLDEKIGVGGGLDKGIGVGGGLDKGIGVGGGLDKEIKEEEEESKRDNFLKEYTVTGTLEPIPKFRASDLHDYRFEAGEIITLPAKMAELLERQKKLFIIEISKEKGEVRE